MQSPTRVLQSLLLFHLIISLALPAFQYIDSSCAQFDKYGGIQKGVDESIRALNAAIAALQQDHSLPQNARIGNMLTAMFGQTPSIEEAKKIVEGLKGEFQSLHDE